MRTINWSEIWTNANLLSTLIDLKRFKFQKMRLSCLQGWTCKSLGLLLFPQILLGLLLELKSKKNLSKFGISDERNDMKDKLVQIWNQVVMKIWEITSITSNFDFLFHFHHSDRNFNSFLPSFNISSLILLCRFENNETPKQRK